MALFNLFANFAMCVTFREYGAVQSVVTFEELIRSCGRPTPACSHPSIYPTSMSTENPRHETCPIQVEAATVAIKSVEVSVRHHGYGR